MGRAGSSIPCISCAMWSAMIPDRVICNRSSASPERPVSTRRKSTCCISCSLCFLSRLSVRNLLLPPSSTLSASAPEGRTEAAHTGRRRPVSGSRPGLQHNQIYPYSDIWHQESGRQRDTQVQCLLCMEITGAPIPGLPGCCLSFQPSLPGAGASGLDPTLLQHSGQGTDDIIATVGGHQIDSLDQFTCFL